MTFMIENEEPFYPDIFMRIQIEAALQNAVVALCLYSILYLYGHLDEDLEKVFSDDILLNRINIYDTSSCCIVLSSL